MHCPFCQHDDTRVIDSRVSDDGATIRRRRECPSCGERFNTWDYTAAHKSLPFGTKVKVTNAANGKSTTVRINDRGPYVTGRCLDLSTAAMQAVGGTSAGVITVNWQVID